MFTATEVKLRYQEATLKFRAEVGEFDRIFLASFQRNMMKLLYEKQYGEYWGHFLQGVENPYLESLEIKL